MKFLLVLLILLGGWSYGLWRFSENITQSTAADLSSNADGIVALTGASDLRIEVALKLLQNHAAQRLLISGVNPEIHLSELRHSSELVHGPAIKRWWDCCIDLDFQATDTHGNALQTRQWVIRNNYKSLIVVTSDYHIPRAMLELKANMPEIELIPYPVATETIDMKTWWQTIEGAKRLILEYNKYLVVFLREQLLHAFVALNDHFLSPAATVSATTAT